MTPRGAAVTSVAAVVGGVGLLLLVALWASSIGPDRVLHGPGLARVTPSLSDSGEPTSASASNVPQQAERPPAESPADHPYLRALAYLIELAVLLFVLWVLWRVLRWARAAWRERIRAPARAEHVDFDVLEQLDEAREQVGADTEDALQLLGQGEPRNGIVAAWDRFETSAASLNLQRRPWETSSEFVLRMLDVVAADDLAVTALERLYREARYSTHALGEDARADAEQALRRIQGSLSALRSRR
jgi:hypothetical protein